MRLLIVYEYYLREGEGGIGRVNRLVRELRRKGNQVTIITGSANYMTGSSSPWRRGSAVCRDASDPQVLRCFIPSSYRRDYTGRAVSYALFTLEALWAGFAHTAGFDAVIASSPPLSTGFVGWLLSRLKRCPWVFEVRDLWPASAIELGGLRSKTAVWLARVLEAQSYAGADAIVVLSPAFVPLLEKQHVPAQKIHVIPNGVEVPSQILDSRTARAQLGELKGFEDAFLVVYVGAHGLANGLEQVVDAAAMLREHGDIAFVFVGDGMYRDALMKRAQEAGLGRVLFVGPQPRERADLFIQAADVCVVSLRDVPVFHSVYPSKLADYMRYGKPVLAAVRGAATEMVENTGCGWGVSPEKPAELARRIVEAQETGPVLAEMGMRGREAVVHTFDLQKVSEDYHELLESVLDRALGVTTVVRPGTSVKRRLLILSSRPPFACDSGFKVRVFNAGVALRKAGWSVDMLAVGDRRDGVPAVERLGGSCDRLFLLPATAWSFRLNLLSGLLSRVPMQVWYYRFPALKRWTRAHACDYSIVFANHARMAPYALTMDVPRVLDLHDSIGLNYRRELAATRDVFRRFSYLMEGRRMERYEASLPAAFARTFVTSAVDRTFIEEHGGRDITVLPVAVRPEALDYSIDSVRPEAMACCFIGRMSYAPNVAAATFFADHVLPRILEKAPEVEFHIIGADPSPAVVALGQRRGVRVMGYVESPYDLITRCAVFVAPMISGSGVQNKILEALALRCAVVTTSLGAAGIPGLQDGVNALIADTANGFSDAAVRLLRDPLLRSRLGSAGRSLIESRYTWEKIGREMVAAVDEALEKRQDRRLA